MSLDNNVDCHGGVLLPGEDGRKAVFLVTQAEPVSDDFAPKDGQTEPVPKEVALKKQVRVSRQ